jgi:hypothetical protein
VSPEKEASMEMRMTMNLAAAVVSLALIAAIVLGMV